MIASFCRCGVDTAVSTSDRHIATYFRNYIHSLWSRRKARNVGITPAACRLLSAVPHGKYNMAIVTDVTQVLPALPPKILSSVFPVLPGYFLSVFIKTRNIHGRPKKRGHRIMTIILSNLNPLKKFDGRFLGKSAWKCILKIPPHLAYVATLTCETLMSAKQAIKDKLQGSVATYFRCGGVVNTAN